MKYTLIKEVHKKEVRVVRTTEVEEVELPEKTLYVQLPDNSVAAIVPTYHKGEKESALIAYNVITLADGFKTIRHYILSLDMLNKETENTVINHLLDIILYGSKQPITKEFFQDRFDSAVDLLNGMLYDTSFTFS